MSSEPVEVLLAYRSNEEEGMVIEASLENAQITVQHSFDEQGAFEASTLVSALPGIMNTVAELTDNQEEA